MRNGSLKDYLLLILFVQNFYKKAGNSSTVLKGKSGGLMCQGRGLAIAHPLWGAIRPHTLTAPCYPSKSPISVKQKDSQT